MNSNVHLVKSLGKSAKQFIICSFFSRFGFFSYFFLGFLGLISFLVFLLTPTLYGHQCSLSISSSSFPFDFFSAGRVTQQEKQPRHQ